MSTRMSRFSTTFSLHSTLFNCTPQSTASTPSPANNQLNPTPLCSSSCVNKPTQLPSSSMAGYNPHEETNPFLYQTNNTHHHHPHFNSNRPVYNARSSERRKPNAHYFCSSFILKLLLVGGLLSLLQLSPSSHTPEFISQHSFLAKTWELLELLVVGILVSYGLFGRRIGGNQTQPGTNYFHDLSLNPSIFNFERQGRRCSGEVGNGSPVAGFSGEESMFVVPPGISDVDYEPMLDLPVRSLKSRVVVSDDEEDELEFGCGGEYESDDVTRYSEEFDVERHSVVSFSSEDSDCGTRQVGYSYGDPSCLQSPVMEEHSWRGNVESAAMDSFCKEDVQVESSFVNLRSRSMRMVSDEGFSSVCDGRGHELPPPSSGPFPIEEVDDSSWTERADETVPSSPGFPTARSPFVRSRSMRRVVEEEFPSTYLSGDGNDEPSSAPFANFPINVEHGVWKDRIETLTSPRFRSNVGESVGDDDPSSYYCEVAESKQAHEYSSPLHSPEGLNVNRKAVELENSWTQQLPRMDNMRSRRGSPPTSRRTRRPMMRMDYEGTSVKDYSSCSSSAASSGYEVHEMDSTRVVFSDTFSGSIISESQHKTPLPDEMESELWRRNALNLPGNENNSAAAAAAAANELPSFSQWISPELGNTVSPSNDVSGYIKPKVAELSESMQRATNLSCDTTFSTVNSTATVEDESLKKEMERLSQMVKQLKSNDNSLTEMEVEKEKEDLNHKKKSTSGSQTSTQDDSNSSISRIVLDDDKLLLSKEEPLSDPRNGRKTLARTRRSQSRRFSCGSFLDRELRKSTREESKYTTERVKAAETVNNSHHNDDNVQAGMCGGWDCLKPPNMIRNSPKGKSVRTIKPSGMDTDSEKRKNDDEGVRVEVSASKEKTAANSSSSGIQDVVVISIGVREKNATSTSTPNLKPKSVKDRQLEKSGSKSSRSRGRAANNVVEEMDSNGEIDKKAGEFIAKFKEQMRLQKAASRRF